MTPDRSQRPQSPEESVLQKGERRPRTRPRHSVGGQEKEEMEQDEEGARASRAREDDVDDEGAKADAKAAKTGAGGVKRRGAQGE